MKEGKGGIFCKAPDKKPISLLERKIKRTQNAEIRE